MDANPDRVDRIRRTRSEVENHVIDELFAGRITRRDFVRRMTVLGMSASLAGFLAACSSDNGGGGTSPSATGASGATGAVVPGGTLKTGIIAPASGAGPARRQRRGRSGRPRTVRRVPRVVQRPARIGAAHRGELDAERRRLGLDVRDPAGGHVPGRHAAHRGRRRGDDGAPRGSEEQVERALRVHRGALARRGEGRSTTRRSSSRWMRRTATSRTWSAPTTTTSSSCPRRIPGAGTRRSSERVRGRCRPTRRTSASRTARTPTTGTPTRQPNADTNQITFYKEDQAKVLGIQGGEVNILSQFSAVSGQGLLNDPNIDVISVRASQHRQVHMRCDQDPFKDKRTRQAVALLLDRPSIIQGLLDGKADLGNDSPFAPVFPSTDTSVPQRALDVEQAKQLLSDAGQAAGFDVTLYTWDNYEIPDLAQVIQQALKPVGINVKLSVDRRRDVLLEVLAGLAARDHRLRASRRAERVPHGSRSPARARGTRPTSRIRRTTRRLPTTWRRSTSARRRRPRRRSRSSCSTRRPRDPVLLLPSLGGAEGVRRRAGDRHGSHRPDAGGRHRVTDEG